MASSLFGVISFLLGCQLFGPLDWHLGSLVVLICVFSFTSGLYEACVAGHREVVEYLVLKGADVQHADEAGWTPLHSCASMGADSTVVLLLEAKANPDCLTSANATPLHMAASKGLCCCIRPVNRPSDWNHRLCWFGLWGYWSCTVGLLIGRSAAVLQWVSVRVKLDGWLVGSQAV